MSNVVLLSVPMNENKFEKLHEALKKKCVNFKTYKKSFDEERGMSHIAKRAVEENEEHSKRIRENLDSRHFAALICHGKLRLEECDVKGEVVKVAIEGVFKDFDGFDSETESAFFYPEIYVRVVIKDAGGRKFILVTAYPLRNENRDSNTPEVDYGKVWD